MKYALTIGQFSCDLILHQRSTLQVLPKNSTLKVST